VVVFVAFDFVFLFVRYHCRGAVCNGLCTCAFAMVIVMVWEVLRGKGEGFYGNETRVNPPVGAHVIEFISRGREDPPLWRWGELNF
jgi:hypothetical protein